LRVLLKPDCLFHGDLIGYAESLKSNAIQGSVKGGIIYPLVTLGFHRLLIPFNFLPEDTMLVTSILMASFSVVLLYLFVKKLTNSIFVSFISAFLFSLSPIFLSASANGMYHSTSAFFIILSAYFILIASQKDSRWLYVLAGVFYGTAIGVRITNVLFILLFILIYFLNQKKEKNIKIRFKKNDIVNISIIFIVCSIASFIFYYPVLQSGGFFNGFLFELGNNTYILSVDLIIFSLRLLGKNFVYWGWIIFLLGIFYLIKENRSILIILLSWFLSYFLYFGMITTTEPRLYTIGLIPVCIIIAFGFLFLCQLRFYQLKFNKISMLIVIILVVNMFFVIYPILKFRYGYCGPKEMALFFKEKTEPNAIIFTEMFNVHVKFYGDRKNEVLNDMETFNMEIEAALDNDIPVYVTETFFIFNQHQPATYILRKQYNLILIGEVLSEYFHGASIRSRKFVEKLYKVEKKD